MVLSYYLYKYPYKIAWYLSKLLFNKKIIAFYCADPLDYEMFLPIAKYLPPVKIIAKNNKTKNYLRSKGIDFINMPVFPDVVIMARQMPYKFPVKSIIKFGFDHGLYQFKRWTAARNYNEFDIYFVSSQEQVFIAKNYGIKSVMAIGYPKNDNAFNGTYNNEKYLEQIRKRLNIDPSKKTILFSTTWNVGGLSKIDKWIDSLELLKQEYNILTTAHTWIDESYKIKLRNIPNTHFLEEYDITPYLILADVLIGDYNSLIGEFCAFDKPIITFKVEPSERTLPDILELLNKISYQVNTFDELVKVIKKVLELPKEKSDERMQANKIFFYALDGLAGKRAADAIMNLLKKKGISFSN